MACADDRVLQLRQLHRQDPLHGPAQGRRAQRSRSSRSIIARWVNAKLAAKDEHALFHATLPFLEGYDDIGPDEVIEKGSKYVNYNFGGEAICSMGKSEDFAKRGLAGIVSVIPFNCMPGNTVTALSPGPPPPPQQHPVPEPGLRRLHRLQPRRQDRQLHVAGEGAVPRAEGGGEGGGGRTCRREGGK